jgi:putative endonuclease
MLFFVYILASQPHGTPYIGSTPDLIRRIWELRPKPLAVSPRNTASIGWVWFEAHESMAAAAKRERQIKEWKRAWKVELIERDNPQWIDLYPTLRA